MDLRRRVYEILTGPRADDRVGRLLSLLLLLVIASNVVANVLETDIELARRAPRFFEWFEIVSVAVFSVEYVARLWSATSDPRFSSPIGGRLRLAVRPMSLIDLAAIAPFYLELFLPSVIDLRFLRVLRLLRVFRLMRFGRAPASFAMLARVIQARRTELGVTLAFVAVAMMVAAGLIYAVEHTQPNTQFTSIPRAMWWSIVTITTVGYGDMTPTTPLGQAIGGMVAFVGICALALPVGILSSGFMVELDRSKAPPMCPHCGRAIAASTSSERAE